MRVGIIQSSYIPWRGYFDFIDDVDLFIFLDDVQFTRCDWRSRNQIKTRDGLRWITVPVVRPKHKELIMEKPLDDRQEWRRQHIDMLAENYRTAPFFKDIMTEFNDVLGQTYDSISSLNIALISWLMKRLEITTPLVHSSDLRVTGIKTERLISILRAVGASCYLSGPAAESYLDVELFREAGIGLEYKSYDYGEYPQLWGDFSGTVTVLDLLFNTGPRARDHLKSRVPNRVVS